MLGRYWDLECLLDGSRGIKPEDRQTIYLWTLQAYVNWPAMKSEPRVSVYRVGFRGCFHSVLFGPIRAGSEMRRGHSDSGPHFLKIDQFGSDSGSK